MREPRNAGIHPHQCISLENQRKNEFINNLQQPMAAITGGTINCYEIDFSDEEWLRNAIRSNPMLEEIYQEVKRTIASSVSSEHFGSNIERNLLEQEFSATINAQDKDEYLVKLRSAVQTLVEGYDVIDSISAQRAYDQLNLCREEITKIVSSKQR